LNNPRMYREASGTSGMAAAMNGAINMSMPDGWVPEFARDMENAFLISPLADQSVTFQVDKEENRNLLDKLEHTVMPLYYDNQAAWLKILKQSAKDVVPEFESSRLAKEYYEKMYKV
jgi:starch phosphorylase